MTRDSDGDRAERFAEMALAATGRGPLSDAEVEAARASSVVLTIHNHYQRQATPEVWSEVDALRKRIADLEGVLERICSRVYSLMRCQEQDCEVNGKNHPGLLEPMRNLLRGLHVELRNAIVDGTATAALCEDIAVPQDCQARAEGIAQPTPVSDHISNKGER